MHLARIQIQTRGQHALGTYLPYHQPPVASTSSPPAFPPLRPCSSHPASVQHVFLSFPIPFALYKPSSSSLPSLSDTLPTFRPWNIKGKLGACRTSYCIWSGTAELGLQTCSLCARTPHSRRCNTLRLHHHRHQSRSYPALSYHGREQTTLPQTHSCSTSTAVVPRRRAAASMAFFSALDRRCVESKYLGLSSLLGDFPCCSFGSRISPSFLPSFTKAGWRAL